MSLFETTRHGNGDGLRLGAIVPNDTGPLPVELKLTRMAQAAEEAGAQSLWVSDHLLMVDEDTADYPYSDDGRPTWSADSEIYEAFTCCAFMAAATTTTLVGTAVLVLPQRNVLEVAKVAASIDQLSGGRLALGVGAGWYAAEFEALGYAYGARGARFDEMLEVLRDCWMGRPGPFRGEHVVVPPGVVLSPRPVQEHGPPLLVGGMTDRALRRAARLGDGWLALAFAETLDVEALGERLRYVRDLRGDLGEDLREHDGSGFQAVVKLHASPDSSSELPSMAAELARAGFEEIVVEPPWPHGIDSACDTIARSRDRLTTEAASHSRARGG